MCDKAGKDHLRRLCWLGKLGATRLSDRGALSADSDEQGYATLRQRSRVPKACCPRRAAEEFLHAENMTRCNFVKGAGSRLNRSCSFHRS
jgi:hypothetical protein